MKAGEVRLGGYILQISRDIWILAARVLAQVEPNSGQVGSRKGTLDCLRLTVTKLRLSQYKWFNFSQDTFQRVDTFFWSFFYHLKGRRLCSQKDKPMWINLWSRFLYISRGPILVMPRFRKRLLLQVLPKLKRCVCQIHYGKIQRHRLKATNQLTGVGHRMLTYLKMSSYVIVCAGFSPVGSWDSRESLEKWQIGHTFSSKIPLLAFGLASRRRQKGLCF